MPERYFPRVVFKFLSLSLQRDRDSTRDKDRDRDRERRHRDRESRRDRDRDRDKERSRTRDKVFSFFGFYCGFKMLSFYTFARKISIVWLQLGMTTATRHRTLSWNSIFKASFILYKFHTKIG